MDGADCSVFALRYSADYRGGFSSAAILLFGALFYCLFWGERVDSGGVGGVFWTDGGSRVFFGTGVFGSRGGTAYGTPCFD